MKIFITILFLLLSTLLYSQKSVEQFDKEWRTAISGKLKKIKVGKKGNGMAVFYYKEDNSIFSVEFREEAGINKKPDSVLSYHFNFKNDTLFRISFSRLDLLNQKNGIITVYINKNEIISQKLQGDIYLPDMKFLTRKADAGLTKAKELVSHK